VNGAKVPFDIRFRICVKTVFFNFCITCFMQTSNPLMTNVEDVKNMDRALAVLSCKRYLKISATFSTSGPSYSDVGLTTVH